MGSLCSSNKKHLSTTQIRTNKMTKSTNFLAIMRLTNELWNFQDAMITNTLSQIFMKVRDLQSGWFRCYGLMKWQFFAEKSSSFMCARIANDIYDAHYQLPIDQYHFSNAGNINFIISKYVISHNINTGTSYCSCYLPITTIICK